MLARSVPATDAVLVNLSFDGQADEGAVEEFRELALSAGARPVATVTGTRKRPEPRYFVGTGKAEEIGAAVARTGAELVLVNHGLSPSQERNLERVVKCRVLDRTGIILDIFAQRASTFEGKLQVELAQLRHLSTRLIRGWTHLERQKGGIGLRGPGETQLETDRRLIGRRIRQLHERLEKIRTRRDQSRRARKRADCFTVSLVGYTNAGKSTLFNTMTGAGAYAADRLFATLDPRLRRIELDGAGPMVVIDTVGFIRDLPHDLVAAFRATLEETLAADLLLHVIDVADDGHGEHRGQVLAVLEDIGAADIPVIEVYNKVDLLDGGVPRAECDADGRVNRVWLSARSGAGVDLLAAALAERAGAHRGLYELRVPVSAPDARARLYRMRAVIDERCADNGDWLLEARLDPRQRAHLDPRVAMRRLDVS